MLQQLRLQLPAWLPPRITARHAAAAFAQMALQWRSGTSLRHLSTTWGRTADPVEEAGLWSSRPITVCPIGCSEQGRAKRTRPTKMAIRMRPVRRPLQAAACTTRIAFGPRSGALRDRAVPVGAGSGTPRRQGRRRRCRHRPGNSLVRTNGHLIGESIWLVSGFLIAAKRSQWESANFRGSPIGRKKYINQTVALICRPCSVCEANVC